MNRLVEIFRAGTHTDMHGAQATLSPLDLERTAVAYNRQPTAAPLVIGHPSDPDPQGYGRVDRLVASGKSLFAEVADVAPELVRWVRDGLYKKVSASFFTPSASGVWRLRHVGFLGAMPPAVKGLAPVAFAQGGAAYVCFSTASVDLPSGGGFLSSGGVDRNPADLLPLMLLKAGVYPVSSGAALRFTVDDLRRMAATYNDANPLPEERRPPKSLAPLLVGNPADGEAASVYGRVESLLVSPLDGNALIGFVRNVSDSLRRAVADKAAPRYQALFFEPDNPSNPVPGSWFLKHIAMLPPAPALHTGEFSPPVEFAEGRRGVVFAEFASIPDPREGGMLAAALQRHVGDRYRGRPAMGIAEAVDAVGFGVYAPAGPR